MVQYADLVKLNFLFGVVLLAGFFIWEFRRRQKILSAVVNPELQKTLLANYHQASYLVKYLLLLGVFIFSVFALARPQWGYEWQEVKRKGTDILIAVDTSKSMLTQDIKPNRLERTKLAVKDMVRQLSGDRVGLIAFSGDAFLVCPLTVDYAGYLMCLNQLDVNTIPRGGTNISQAIEEAIKTYAKNGGDFKTLIIITDGDNLEGDPQSAADKAKSKGITIYTIGVGTRNGDLIQIDTADGRKEFLKDTNGHFVKSRLNEALLKDVALTTGGAYVKAGGAQFGISEIYGQFIAHLEKREFESAQEKRFYERFQIPLLIALILLVTETCLTRLRKL